MAEIINLRQARKQRQRAEKEALARENRIRFGRTRAERQRVTEDLLRQEHALDGKRREPEVDKE